MDQKEWKRLIHLSKDQRPKDFFKYRNIAEKLLGYKRRSGLTIHHLRDTEEQRNFNDLYYERWGIDFDGQMKYCICITTEEHKKLHTISEETRQKIAESVTTTKSKNKLTPEQRRENKNRADLEWKEKNMERIKTNQKRYYEENKEEILKKRKEYRETHKEEIAARKKAWKAKNRDKVLEAKRRAYRKKRENMKKSI